MNEQLFNAARSFIRQVFDGDSSGHDHWHSIRVWELTRTLCQQEGGDSETAELAALLHDVDDCKLFGGEMGGCSRALAFMEAQGVPKERRQAVADIIRTVSFKGTDTAVPGTLEGKIVQDADRLDAIGAIGIARTFAYGGSRGRTLYDPGEPPALGMNAEEYRRHQSHTVNHFYEKLLLLKELMNTPSARAMAEARHRFMEQFLGEFFAEWDGKR